MKTAIYLRKSRAEELSDTVEETLKRHREILTEYAGQNGLEVIRIYEEVISGESLCARPQMLELLADVERGRYEAVLCMDIDRLGRGAMSDQGVILETLKSANTKIITPRKIYDLNNEMDETYSEFETFLARQELKTIKRRMQRGIQKTIQEGGYIANAPYGYTKAIVSKRPTLAVNEEEARFVRMMFNLYINQGMGCGQIAELANSMGAKPHRAGKFGRTSVMAILRNPVYTGEIVWNRMSHIRKGTKGNQKHITVNHPRNQWTVTKGLHPPLIDQGLFNQAQAIRAGRFHRPAKQYEIENPLAGLVYCSHCGAPMQRQVLRPGYAYLLCTKPGCMVSSSLQLVEESVLRQLNECYRQIRLKQEQDDSSPDSENRQLLNAVEREARAITRQRENLHDLLEQGIYNAETFQNRLAVLNERMEDLERTKQAIERRIPQNYINNSISINNIIRAYYSASCGLKNDLLRTMIDKIVYSKDKGAKPAEFKLEIYLKPLY